MAIKFTILIMAYFLDHLVLYLTELGIVTY